MSEKLTPRQMGERDYKAGKAVTDAPWPMHVPEGQDWENGYIVAEIADRDNDRPDDDAVLKSVPVRLIFDGADNRVRRVRVTDQRGRILDGQMGLVMEQVDDGRFNISVSFAGLKLEGMARGGIIKPGTQLA